MKKLFLFNILLLTLALISNKIDAQTSDPGTPLFEIKNELGQTVFAVYPGGVHIFVDDDAQKATGGGFKVGRIGTEKAAGDDIFTVVPGAVNVFLDNTQKATGGGFKVGRIGTEKATGNDIFTVVPGEVNVYLDNTTQKATGGGFKVGRIGTEKAAGDSVSYLTVTADSTSIFTNDTISGFSVSDNSAGTGISYMRLSPLNYFIGHSSGLKVQLDPLNPGMGKYNTFFGFNAGKNTVSGFQNVFLGYNAGLNCVGGGWNVFIGNNAGASSSGTLSSIMIGDQAGYNLTNGTNNIFIGKEAGFSATGTVFNNVFVGSSAGNKMLSGYYNTYLGTSAGYNCTGNSNTFVGNLVGFSNLGSQNTYVGNESGIYSGSGARNVYIGHRSGYRSSGSGNVFIGNSANNTNTSTVTYSNCVAIGDSTIVNGSNQVRLGNNNITAFYCMGAYNSTTATAANLVISASGQFLRSTSSARYKRDIVPLEINTSKIYKLNPVSFTDRNENTRHFGLIAEEVAEIIPELAGYSKEKDVIPGSKSEKLIPDAVQYPILSVLLLKEIQKHELTINEQQKAIEVLKAQNQQLNKNVKGLTEKNLELTGQLSDIEKLKAEIEELKRITIMLTKEVLNKNTTNED